MAKITKKEPASPLTSSNEAPSTDDGATVVKDSSPTVPTDSSERVTSSGTGAVSGAPAAKNPLSDALEEPSGVGAFPDLGSDAEVYLDDGALEDATFLDVEELFDLLSGSKVALHQLRTLLPIKESGSLKPLLDSGGPKPPPRYQGVTSSMLKQKALDLGLMD